jgi:hypothetical protein
MDLKFFNKQLFRAKSEEHPNGERFYETERRFRAKSKEHPNGVRFYRLDLSKQSFVRHAKALLLL